MSDPSLSGDETSFHPKQIFPNFRGPNYETEPQISTEAAEASDVGFGSDLIFTPIVGGHLNFSTPEDDDSEYPVNYHSHFRPPLLTWWLLIALLSWLCSLLLM